MSSRALVSEPGFAKLFSRSLHDEIVFITSSNFHVFPRLFFVRRSTFLISSDSLEHIPRYHAEMKLLFVRACYSEIVGTSNCHLFEKKR